jgi:hypothetical protein
MTYFDYFKVLLLKVGILNFVHISNNKNNYCDIERDKYGFYFSLNDNLHRVDGPAIEYYDGDKEWWQNDKLHRIDGPAIEHADGSKEWYQNGKLHRLNGPAIDYYNRYKEWYQNGLCHRLDGPACECANGSKYWFYEGKKIGCKSQEEFERYIKLKLFW